MSTSRQRILLDGPDGAIEVFVEENDGASPPTGIALVAHPHPLMGGSADSKVVTTLAKAFRELGCVTFRPSFRGVGGSEGEHDHGVAETEDLLAVLAHARAAFGDAAPLHLAGFSFGAYVVTRLAQRLREQGEEVRRMVLVGVAAGFVEGARHYDTPAAPPETIVIHGGRDETVPLTNVLAWAEPLDLPVTVIPGADHFFHRRLHLLRSIMHRQWH